jgi:hypothetical protein
MLGIVLAFGGLWYYVLLGQNVTLSFSPPHALTQTLELEVVLLIFSESSYFHDQCLCFS